MGITPNDALRRIRQWDAARRWTRRHITPLPPSPGDHERPVPGTIILGALKFPATARNVTDARSYLTRLLSPGPADVLDTVLLLTTELITNSVRHATNHLNGTITMAVLGIHDHLRIEVADEGSPTTPCLRPDADDLSDGGRGLHLVDLLATRWGFTRDTTGTTTWFEINCPPYSGGGAGSRADRAGGAGAQAVDA
ncbi:ATP-binding protein [Thermopolyspora sp. NPDC052614]|uniref:ATP-binding protein n=1 Tax=Thermopolyspora sp. NPDC052614 TaxID=3155682 RepID=UPI00343565D0